MKRESRAALWFALALTDLRLRLLPHRCNRTLLQADPRLADVPFSAAQPPAQPDDASRRDEILGLAELVRSVARHRFVFNMSCLRQALVLRARLRARGIQASLVYGARRNAAGFGAHAWVEAGGMRLDGAPDQMFSRFEEKS